MQPTATHWVTRNQQTGEKMVLAVTEMTTPHLLRWVLYWRRIYASRGARGPNDIEPDNWVLDGAIKTHIVTGDAIYRELFKRLGYHVEGAAESRLRIILRDELQVHELHVLPTAHHGLTAQQARNERRRHTRARNKQAADEALRAYAATLGGPTVAAKRRIRL